MSCPLENLLAYLSQCSGFDFPRRRHAFCRKKIDSRISALGCAGTREYHRHLTRHPKELRLLLNTLTVNVSSFFRTPLTFEYLDHKILGAVIADKQKDRSGLRIWSAGCAMGEEAYSLAIQIREHLEKQHIEMDVRIFGTDIDSAILEQAVIGRFQFDQIKNVRHERVQRYFRKEGKEYRLDEEIKKMVDFSFYDMMDPRTHVPPESVFGDFDLVLCRNVLIYFSRENQKKICEKLYRSIAPKGYLILGQSETIHGQYTDRLIREIPCCQIFRKPDPHA